MVTAFSEHEAASRRPWRRARYGERDDAYARMEGLSCTNYFKGVIA
jgi:hypothetical protein